MEKKMNITAHYGHSTRQNFGVIDHKTFVEQNQQTIVVAEKDELLPLLCDDDSLNIANDVSLLLNKRRLQNADPKYVAEMIKKRFAERNVSTSLFDGLSDTDIFNAIKGRHIQSLSELDAYSEYLANNLGDSISSRQKQKELLAMQDKQKDNSEESLDDK